MEIKNRQAYYEYFIEDKLLAGIALLGTEVKSLRLGKANFADAYCIFSDGELWLKAMNIAEYSHGNVNNHVAVRDRKLLLTKRELKKWDAKMKEKGFTIIPLRLFMNEKNFVKVEIGLAKGKKMHDKRDSIKQKDTDREMKRFLK
ncbi:MAG: smpB [Flavisolibacter sp.]|jgi:SsrA-binding protein|nr:smpB [Flavisolibacter sp.]